MKKLQLYITLLLFVTHNLFAQQKRAHQSSNDSETSSTQSKEKQSAFGATKIHPVHQNIIYVATLGKIIKSMDGGINWKTIYSQKGLWVNEFAMPSANPDVVLADTNEGLLRSKDGGKNWASLFDTLPEAEKTVIEEDVVVYKPEPKITEPEQIENTDKKESLTPKNKGKKEKKRTLRQSPNLLEDVDQSKPATTIAPKVTISPNPINNDDIAKIETNLKGESKFRLFASNSQVVRILKFEGSGEVDMSGLTNGSYFYRVENGKFIMGGVLLIQ
jgi:hypothetical protein